MISLCITVFGKIQIWNGIEIILLLGICGILITVHDQIDLIFVHELFVDLDWNVLNDLIDELARFDHHRSVGFIDDRFSFVRRGLFVPKHSDYDMVLLVVQSFQLLISCTIYLRKILMIV